MRIDISFLPAYGAAFMLVFARIGAMVMLLPGLGEVNIPVRIKLAIALLLTMILLPLHRAAFHVDMQTLAPLAVQMVQEIFIGIVLGATARALVGQFGNPDLDLREGPARKLQFLGPACVLDAYLYPPRSGRGEAVVTHVDARQPDGREMDRSSCVAALTRRPEAR